MIPTTRGASSAAVNISSKERRTVPTASAPAMVNEHQPVTEKRQADDALQSSTTPFRLGKTASLSRRAFPALRRICDLKGLLVFVVATSVMRFVTPPEKLSELNLVHAREICLKKVPLYGVVAVVHRFDHAVS
eukprot:IDg16747t1